LYLAALGVPEDNGYFIVSPNFWSSRRWTPGVVFPITLNSDNNEELKVPVYKVRSESGIAGYTIADPKCFNNGPPGQGFEAGGYQTYTYWNEYHQRYETKTTGWHWFSKQPNSPVYVTKEYASRAWSMTETTWAKLCYKYLYNITCSGVEVISVARESGGKDRYAAYFCGWRPGEVRNLRRGGGLPPGRGGPLRSGEPAGKRTARGDRRRLPHHGLHPGGVPPGRRCSPPVVQVDQTEGEIYKEHPDVLCYREAFQRLGINPNRFPCSVEALTARIAVF